MGTKSLGSTIEATKEGQISSKKLGANIIVTIPGNDKPLGRKVSKEEYEAIAKKIISYNKKPNDKTKEQIIKMLTPVAATKAAEKEKKDATVKGLKQQVKKADKVVKAETKEHKSFLQMFEDELTANPDAVGQMQKILDKFKKEEPKPVPAPVPVYGHRRRGEH